MTLSAPACLASRAYAAACSAVAAETPHTPAPCPAPAATTVSVTSRRSSRLRLPPSPTVPLGTIPWIPPSINRWT